jgi:hypothetical protein
MPPARFEPTIPESERPQTHALDDAATGIDPAVTYKTLSKLFNFMDLSTSPTVSKFI